MQISAWVRRAIKASPPQCPVCKTRVLGDDAQVTLNRRRHHTECAVRVLGRLRVG